MDNTKIVQKIVMAGIVYSDNKVLILQRRNDEAILPGLWELPSGKRESMEPSIDALKREVLEETRLSVEPVMPVYVFDYAVKKGDEVRDTTQINYLVKPISGTNVKISHEHQNYKWISEDQLSTCKLSDNTQLALRKAFEILKIIEKPPVFS
ncbi:MAG: hypothetical protein A3H57_00785 [Candidatus Taylorbacteria bacterium RIFCSPLOWO2_02_FULL_43_11]|uniref:Nudix hydrolase domain-containing protein n=1 Tax=Candidatus Taylorbacteria bacterium RIFCSPHIGHO2_02_FULL_43_32b TaxID=1802306 RepID=A0A1G2MKN2_9BACT|nr:MAG: hypothetical protein A2743_03465 [Candidatus Taylorbacteria bacterium RIFCSPHIGHO2_01_FULL_43_47]OHA24495.1 MAG: hypothetical protein A3C72_00915 [Candidatus Taylorbacteria bacterium RIFCSPHIGHO2_02_FULL_43_32b]OHA31809.1 MAG: hypothetical protein A3B08_01210 [Candidatus Taylorbacteria bacterium RIFCSPLOWO2_01_FULL_43_44]OHA36690.1 MAG: hypothetical protein A3H57_00785 [Candidatus Taylorbacteria bacterium RIFCSPLOWO2_02_FULL_43_11]